MEYIVRGAIKSLGLMFASMIGLHAKPAGAATCSVSATPIAFGQYNAVTRTAVNTTATVTVTCTGLLFAASYTISISPGQSGTATNRYLISGSNKLRYQVYVDAARTIIAGDGSGGTSVLWNEMAPLLGLFSASKTEIVYSTVLSNQAAAPGSYADALTLIITY